MATWGAYFGSYVKKKSDPAQIELAEQKERDFLNSTPKAPKPVQKPIAAVKKLYDIDIAAEEPVQGMQRSNSNVARVAKMFGYGTKAPEEEVKPESVAPKATWTKIESTPVSTPVAQPLAQPVVPDFKRKRFASPKPADEPTAPAPAPTTAFAFPNPERKHTSKPSKEDIFAMLENFASFADNPDATNFLPIVPEQKEIVSLPKLQTKNFTPVKRQNPALARKDSGVSFGTMSPMKRSPSSSRNASISSWSPISLILSRPQLFSPRKQSLSEPSEDFRARMAEFERQAEQFDLEKKQREEEREEIIKFERMQNQMRYEREKMYTEREKMMEEQRKFQEEEDRIAEEEKQMEQFMKNFQVEMDRDRENENRKRKAAEDAERQRLKAIEDEKRRIREEVEEAEREEERRRQEKLDKEQEERELREYEERRAARQREAEEKERKLLLKDERLAQEEAERLTAKILEAEKASRRKNEYEVELEADRLRFEQKESEDERLRLQEEEAESERQREYEAERKAKEQAKRQKYEQEKAEKGRQRVRDERFATQRRVAEERAQRAQFDEDEARRRAQNKQDMRFEAEGTQGQDYDDDGRPLTKEEQMNKAEDKIRRAFKGLAAEKSQNGGGYGGLGPLPQMTKTSSIKMPTPRAPAKNYAKGITPAEKESRVYKRGEDEQTPGVSRFNTTGRVRAGPRPQPKIPGVLPKDPTRLAQGGGLPGGPRAGLRTGPGPRSNQTMLK